MMSIEEGRMAQFFDRCAREGLMDEFTPTEAVKLKYFLQLWSIAPGQRVLEPGCGAGRLTQWLAGQVGPEGEVVACDLSQEMIARARARELPHQAKLLRASVLALDAPGEYFDHVICLNVFPHFAARESILSELARILKPGGRLWVHHFESREGINAFHRQAAPEVESHGLPADCEMRMLFHQSGLQVLRLDDMPEYYILEAVKPSAA